MGQTHTDPASHGPFNKEGKCPGLAAAETKIELVEMALSQLWIQVLRRLLQANEIHTLRTMLRKLMDRKRGSLVRHSRIHRGAWEVKLWCRLGDLLGHGLCPK